MSRALGVKTSKTRRPAGSSNPAAARNARSFWVSSCMWRSERKGIVTRATRSVHRGLAEVAEAQVQQGGDPLVLRVGPRAREHAGRLVDAYHLDTGPGDRHGDTSRADGQLDDRPARGDGLLDVELDVLRDGGRPRVVDPRDPVVERSAHGIGFRATQTNSGLSSSNERRSNQP